MQFHAALELLPASPDSGFAGQPHAFEARPRRSLAASFRHVLSLPLKVSQTAEKLRLGRMKGWRVPTRDELAGIFPATERPFTDTKYAKDPAGPDQMNSYWTSELDPGRDDYAFVYQWYRDGAPNNCFASKNFVYVRCVHDPVKRR